MIAELRALFWIACWVAVLPFRAAAGFASEVLDDVHAWLDRRIR